MLAWQVLGVQRHPTADRSVAPRAKIVHLTMCCLPQLRALSPGEQESVRNNSKSLASLPRYQVGLNTVALSPVPSSVKNFADPVGAL